MEFSGFGFCKSDSSVPISHLDYQYIRTCNDGKYLEKIVQILRSGEEGSYPDLLNTAEVRLEQLNPESKLLLKDTPSVTSKQLKAEERDSILSDIENWTNSMSDVDRTLLQNSSQKSEPDANLPPIRQADQIEINTNKPSTETDTSPSKNHNPVPRDYKEWDKFDVEREIQNADATNKDKEEEGKDNTSINGTSRPDIQEEVKIDDNGLSEDELKSRASHEKSKGNESFKASNFSEALVYYNRGLSIYPLVEVYNNRAITYIKLEKFHDAIEDCFTVLEKEPTNLKAYLRRGCAYQSLHEWQNAAMDFQNVLQIEPGNKRAKTLLQEIKRNSTDDKILPKTANSSETETADETTNPCLVDADSRHGSDDQPPVQESNGTADEENQTRKGTRLKIVEVDGTEEDQEVINGNNAESSCGNIDLGHDTCMSNAETETSTRLSHPASDSSEDRPDAANTASSKKGKKITIMEVDNESEVIGWETTNTDNELQVKNNITESISGSTEVAASVSKPAGESTDKSTEDECQIKESHNALAEEDASSELAVTPETVTHTPVIPGEFTDKSAEEECQIKESHNALANVDVASKPVVTPETVTPTPVIPVPGKVLELKDAGNTFFKAGNYPEASEKYSEALNVLSKEEHLHAEARSTLLSNRAVCRLKVGDCKGCIEDATESLTYKSSAKGYLRRATAKDQLERYEEAYVDYQAAVKLDPNTKAAWDALTRLVSLLRDKHGFKWRDHLPSAPVLPSEYTASAAIATDRNFSTKEPGPDPLATDKGTSPQSPDIAIIQSLESNAHKTQEQHEPEPQKMKHEPEPQKIKPLHPEVKKPPPAEPIKETKEQKFKKLKDEGNTHVQKGKYKEAINCYSKCIEYLPEEVVSYTNRALCFLKLNEPKKAEDDCNKALELQSSNVKALFRRAQARKALNNLRDSIADLMNLLKVEPENAAAKKELEIVKDSWRQELRKIQSQQTTKKTEATQTPKTGSQSKVKDAEKGPTPVSSQDGLRKRKNKSQKDRGVNANQKGVQSEKCCSHCPGTDLPAVHEEDLKLSKATPFEFWRAWNCVKRKDDTKSYAAILSQIQPSQLSKVISNKIDGDVIPIMVSTVRNHFLHDDLVFTGFRFLEELAKVHRFKMALMFLSAEDTAMIRRTVLELEKQCLENKKLSLATVAISNLKRSYGVQ